MNDSDVITDQYIISSARDYEIWTNSNLNNVVINYSGLGIDNWKELFKRLRKLSMEYTKHGTTDLQDVPAGKLRELEIKAESY